MSTRRVLVLIQPLRVPASKVWFRRTAFQVPPHADPPTSDKAERRSLIELVLRFKCAGYTTTAGHLYALHDFSHLNLEASPEAQQSFFPFLILQRNLSTPSRQIFTQQSTINLWSVDRKTEIRRRWNWPFAAKSINAWRPTHTKLL